jgi:hypothetical protein
MPFHSTITDNIAGNAEASKLAATGLVALLMAYAGRVIVKRKDLRADETFDAA